jgi:hypothetical protein
MTTMTTAASFAACLLTAAHCVAQPAPAPPYALKKGLLDEHLVARSAARISLNVFSGISCGTDGQGDARGSKVAFEPSR